MKNLRLMVVAILFSFSVFGQEINKEEINAIPYPLEKWNGVQKKTLKDSKPDFISPKKAPEGSPNVLVIMLDDTGYSSASSFGGSMNTPAFDRIGDEGVRYTHMSVNAICSPTRGSLLTGYNMHQIGTGVINEAATGYPGYSSDIDYTTPSVAKILKDNGYATAAFGKWHNTKLEDASPAGPFEGWPTGMWGFEFFYGFMGGETNQFFPLLYQGTTPIDTPTENADGSQYHISADMADQTIKWLDNWKGLRDDPFFIYYAPGAVHAPIHVPDDWRDKYKGRYEEGYETLRLEQFQKQKEIGLVPQDAELVDWPTSIPAWDSFSEEGKVYLRRQMEVNAAFLEYTDFHIGRVITHLEEMGELDNTFVMYLTADNGCSAEGTPTGSCSELLTVNGFPEFSMEEQLEMLDKLGGLEEWGGPNLANHYAVGWSYASSTPFQWTKQMASHFGGVMTSTAIRYPKEINARGEWRRQFQNVTDIVPTILDVTGVPAPDYVNGQKRMEYPGVSMRYAWNDTDAKTNHKTQYFETLGFIGIYHDGWSLAAEPYRVPWLFDAQALANLGNLDPDNIGWELYYIDEDPIQSKNIADQHPEKVKELEKLFWVEAEKYNVFPVGAGLGTLLQPESSTAKGAKKYWEFTTNTYRVPEMAGPEIKTNDFEVNAYITADETTEGVIYALGEHMGGQALYIVDGQLMFTYQTLGYYTYESKGTQIPYGDIKVTLKHTVTERKITGPADVELYINDQLVETVKVGHTVSVMYGGHETFDIGRDEGMPVSHHYEDKGKFKFTAGQLKKVTFEIGE
ncbi:sulfatase-like hydrolase/transferase [Flammeovirga yaeyamensis]|uniref:Sulfatase-like hydrolase/transferase n=1 Tax=Flammeovirga yaeyamensis TaxID=367791 RepID=A0AAX1N9Q3_9BACT|nr:arylsulfatase [Flammeovirga yaeyamensis]MBB3699428.1 arylsulfatase [Flammeovirga yaeyamensis]NMF35314.1 arylsulfatase [Flammeovirga yaeyamensis]QWG04174.1 sulfatase-like hydrolase/transferase [Flammeovirga yaeyamensis]